MTRIVESRLGVLVSTEAAETSAGAADAGRIPQLDAAGLLDSSLFPGSGLSVDWGDINGTLADQLDLVAALAAKLDDSQASVYGLTLLAAASAAAAKTLLLLAKADVGLSNVDDTSDATKNAASVTLTNKTFALGSNSLSGTKAQFDVACTDGNFLYVGDITQYTDELAQDAIGGMVDSSLVYVDGTPLLTRAALTGDATAAQGSNALTLATVNANVGSFGSATQVGTFTVNAKGLITAAANATVTPAVGSITGLGAGIATFLGTPSSSNLLAAITDETGTGALVFAASPAFTGTATFQALTTTGNVTIGDATTDTHSVTGGLTFNTGATPTEIHASTGGQIKLKLTQTVGGIKSTVAWWGADATSILTIHNVAGTVRHNFTDTGWTFRSGATTIQTGSATGVDTVGEVRCDTLRIDATETVAVVATDRWVPININGTVRKLLIAP